MKCQYASCKFNSIHDADRPALFCDEPDRVEINIYRECNGYRHIDSNDDDVAE